MNVFVCDLRDTKFNMSEVMPNEDVIRSYLESKGIETGHIAVKANGLVVIHAETDPMQNEIWQNFTDTPINPGILLAHQINDMMQYRKLFRDGRATEQLAYKTLDAVCAVLLNVVGVGGES